MASLKWTDEALAWLREIHDYIAADNPSAATEVMEGIIGRAEQLATFPDSGSRLRVLPEGDLRMWLYGHYRIAYLQPGDGGAITIIGVFHGALDIDRYLP